MKKDVEATYETAEEIEIESTIRVGDIMSTNLLTVGRKDNLQKASKMMKDYRIEAVLVSGGKKTICVGILTAKDIIYKVVAIGKDVKNTRVEDVMTKKLITITPKMTIEDAAMLMKKNDIRRLPVVNEKNNEIVGIITESDISRISPEVHNLIIERKIAFRDFAPREKSDNGGVCESCGDFSDNLVVVNSELLCENCRESKTGGEEE